MESLEFRALATMPTFKRFLTLALLLSSALGAQPVEPCTVHTVVGDPVAFSGAGQPALGARLFLTLGVARNDDGTVYVADQLNHRILRINPHGVLSVVTGNGEPSHFGDGGPAWAAAVSLPTWLELGPDGSLYFSESYRRAVRIRRIRPNGIIDTVAGNGELGLPVIDALATATPLDNLRAMAIDPEGTLFMAVGGRILKIDDNGILRVFGGDGDTYVDQSPVPIEKAKFILVTSLHFDSDGVLYLSDGLGARIYTVDRFGNALAIAGTGIIPFSGDGPALTTNLSHPHNLVKDTAGNIYFVDSLTVRRIRDSQIETPTTITLPASWVALPNGALLLSTADSRLLIFEPETGERLFAGREQGLQTGAPLEDSFIPNPLGLEVDSLGRTYVGDGGSRSVYRVGETLEKVADLKEIFPDEDLRLVDIAVDSNDRLHLLAGFFLYRVLRQNADGQWEKLAGWVSGFPSFSAQGPIDDTSPPAVHTRILSATALAVNQQGEIFIGRGRDGVLEVDLQGRIGIAPIGTPWAPLGTYRLGVLSMSIASDGALWVGASRGLHRYANGVDESVLFPDPAFGLVVASDGNVYVSGNDSIWKMSPGSAPIPTTRSFLEFRFGEGDRAAKAFVGRGPLAIDHEGNLLAASNSLSRVRKIVQPQFCPDATLDDEVPSQQPLPHPPPGLHPIRTPVQPVGPTLFPFPVVLP